ncbi:hypothetical protein [Psychrobacter aquaticus]|uniref:Uncharacterized protein n=1 Tax=Psychrobacter aquaticus CMS 56 TaxID=1354303 RepID=U4TA04_9GAMM|nr:hypothetical protein [Psychrobacter aquaticus]ERL55313.1 hypothetical protein M917_1837 [Psychrobacter aquaticus CMS 56]
MDKPVSNEAFIMTKASKQDFLVVRLLRAAGFDMSILMNMSDCLFDCSLFIDKKYQPIKHLLVDR